MMLYRSSSTFVAFNLLLQELLPFAKMMFSEFLSVVFWDIDFKVYVWICLDVIQVELYFCNIWVTFMQAITYS